MTNTDNQITVEIKYGDYILTVPLKDVREAIALLKDDRIRNVDFMRSVNLTLELYRNILPRSPRPAEDHENFCHDVVIWFADGIIHGRASITTQSTIPL